MRDVEKDHEVRDAYFDLGPLSSILRGDPKARILDQVLLLGSGEFTISHMADGTNLSYKTVQSYLEHLQSIKWVTKTRKIGNAQAYRFDVNHMGKFIKWATDYQKRRIE